MNDHILPQHIRGIITINAPSMFRNFIALAKPLMSKSSMEKLNVCLGSNLKEKSVENCPFIKKWNLENPKNIFPKEYGGELTFS